VHLIGMDPSASLSRATAAAAKGLYRDTRQWLGSRTTCSSTYLASMSPNSFFSRNHLLALRLRPTYNARLRLIQRSKAPGWIKFSLACSPG